MGLPTRWKLIGGGAALAGLTVGGVAGASGLAFGLNDQRPPIELSERAALRSTQQVSATTLSTNFFAADDAGFEDLSPESADSPNESVEDSADSPFDSPDDAGFVDLSPESVDSPNESAEDSPAWVPAETAEAPAAPVADSPVSADSPDSIDSD